MRARIPVGSVVSGEVSQTCGRLVSGVFGILFALVRSANAIAASW